MSYADLAAEVTSATCTPPEPRTSFTTLLVAALAFGRLPANWPARASPPKYRSRSLPLPLPGQSGWRCVPSPPTPKTAAVGPARILGLFEGAMNRDPAQSSGAACSEGSASGILITWLAGAFANSAYPPSTMTPVMRCFMHRFSLPSRQNSHLPHVHCTHGTPTRSPISTLLTAAPRSTTRPTISCPRISGFFTMPANSSSRRRPRADRNGTHRKPLPRSRPRPRQASAEGHFLQR